jgi:predicted dehydrogenase
MNENVLLAGVGFMGRAYGAILKELHYSVIAIGRSAAGVEEFERVTGLNAHAGGVARWLEGVDSVPASAIVCVGTDEVTQTCRTLLSAGVKRILVEKPGGASPRDIADLTAAAQRADAEVLVGYNRRFYASVLEAERRISAEGGVTAVHFEFTERERDATLGKFSEEVRRHWALANSSHVIDLAFFLSGDPVRISTEVAGSLAWHPSAAQFAGSGRTARGALFSYCANWASGGRWGVEVMTPESRLILRPLETLSIQRRGSFVLETVAIDDELENRFKPGLYRQVAAFLRREEPHRFISIAEQSRKAQGLYAAMSGYGDAASASGERGVK